jgi:hypothetical protein
MPSRRRYLLAVLLVGLATLFVGTTKLATPNVSIAADSIQLEQLPTRGLATAVLIRQGSSLSFYDRLIERNLAISKNEWSLKVDHLVFVESALPDDQVQYIQTKSKLAIKFVDVGATFTEGKSRSNAAKISGSDKCTEAEAGFEKPVGYNVMCWFWFSEFLHYVQAYDQVLRIDDDCILAETFDWPLSTAHVASVAENAMDNRHVIVGMRDLFASHANIPLLFPRYWSSPYTNVCLYNVKNIRLDARFRRIVDAVDGSKCIWINRWGDLPLWGATRALLGFPHQHLQFTYRHGTHKNVLIKPGDEYGPARGKARLHQPCSNFLGGALSWFLC